MTPLDLVAAAAVGYFLGGLPTAAIAAKLRGRDVFEVGSGNMGAMNAARNVGWGAGVVVLLVDVGKGAAATAAGGWMADLAGLPATLPTALAAGVGAVVGHAWSPWVRFRGGKALATLYGALLAVAPLAAVYGVALLVSLLLLLRRPTLASVLALAGLPFVAGASLLRAEWHPERAYAVVTATGLAVLASIAKHLLALRGARG